MIKFSPLSIDLSQYTGLLRGHKVISRATYETMPNILTQINNKVKKHHVLLRTQILVIQLYVMEFIQF